MSINKHDMEVLEVTFMWVPKHVIKEKFSEREYGILCAKLNGETYKAVGEVYGVSPERVRQIFCKVIRRLKWYATRYRNKHIEPLVQIRDTKPVSDILED